MRDVSFSKIKTTSLLAALVMAVMLLWGNVAHAVPTEAETWAANQTGWGTIDGWYELTSTVGSLWVAEISEAISDGFQFEYALWNEDYDTHCANFKIWNPGGYTLTSITEPTGWSHVIHSDYIQWIASDPYVLEWAEGDGLFGYQVINQNVTVGLVPSDAWDGYFQCPIASGYISGPVPEPGTIMLISSLATGLFGIAAIRKRRS